MAAVYKKLCYSYHQMDLRPQGDQSLDSMVEHIQKVVGRMIPGSDKGCDY